jgi:cold shock CspA family protein
LFIKIISRLYVIESGNLTTKWYNHSKGSQIIEKENQKISYGFAERNISKSQKYFHFDTIYTEEFSMLKTIRDL